MMHGFALLPDKLTEAKLVTFNNTNFPEPLKLDTSVAVPHVTVLQAPIRAGFKATPFLEEFKASYPLRHEPKANLGKLMQVNEHWIFMEVTNPHWLQQLNALVIEAVADWIDVDAAPKPSSFRNEAERISYEKTGYRYNLESYSPHFTVGVKDEVADLPDASHLTGLRVPFRQLAFCEHGEHGEIVNILETIHLPYTWD